MLSESSPKREDEDHGDQGDFVKCELVGRPEVKVEQGDELHDDVPLRLPSNAGRGATG